MCLCFKQKTAYEVRIIDGSSDVCSSDLVEAYRDELGILPEALENDLLRLGWGHGDDEIISRAQAIEWFTVEAVGRAPARFDAKKLESVNAHYIRAADDARLAALVAQIGRAHV